MKVCNLASGSKGNSTFIETLDGKFLFDAGKNIKYLTEELEKINVSIKDIDYVIISHIHSDHISALKQILKKSKAILCVSEKIFYELSDLKDYEHVILLEDELNVNNTKIISFKSSHDTLDSRNFVITDNVSKVCYITDTGYINRKYFDLLTNCDVYLFESNHDIEMLENGPYPKWLKTRVLSDKGHLSNNSAGFYLSKLIGNNTKKVMLMHLSEVNNDPKIALNTVKDVLKEYDVLFDNFLIADQYHHSEVIEL